MYRKLLLALAACLPLALSGCGGGGGGGSASPASQSPSTSPSAGGGTQTPEAALTAAKTAVDNANSAKTEAAVQRAIRALSAAVDTAEAAKAAAQDDLEAARAALTEAREYKTEQDGYLDTLQPASASARPAAVKPASASLAFEARQALDAAKLAMAGARRTRSEAAIRNARSRLSEAVDKAQESFDAFTAIARDAEAALTEARDYRDEQTPHLNSIPITRLPGMRPPPSSPPGEFRVTHAERSFLYFTNFKYAYPPAGFYDQCRIPHGYTGDCYTVVRGFYRLSPFDRAAVVRRDSWLWYTELRPERSGGIHPQPVESYWPNVRGDARGLDYGFYEISRPNGITIARKDFPSSKASTELAATRNPGFDRIYDRYIYDRYIVGIGSYSAFEMLSEIYTGPNAPVPYNGGFASAFGERSLQAPNWTRPGPNPQTTLRFVYRGAMAGVKHRERGELFTGSATLTYRPNIAGDRISLELREYRGQGVYGPWMLERDMSPNNDGSFSDASDSVKGDFYGPNWDEAAGIVQTRDVYGAWLVHRPFRFQGESSFGPVLGQHTGPPFALNDFIQ